MDRNIKLLWLLIGMIWTIACFSLHSVQIIPISSQSSFMFLSIVVSFTMAPDTTKTRDGVSKFYGEFCRRQRGAFAPPSPKYGPRGVRAINRLVQLERDINSSQSRQKQRDLLVDCPFARRMAVPCHSPTFPYRPAKSWVYSPAMSSQLGESQNRIHGPFLIPFSLRCLPHEPRSHLATLSILQMSWGLPAVGCFRREGRAAAFIDQASRSGSPRRPSVAQAPQESLRDRPRRQPPATPVRITPRGHLGLLPPGLIIVAGNPLKQRAPSELTPPLHEFVYVDHRGRRTQHPAMAALSPWLAPAPAAPRRARTAASILLKNPASRPPRSLAGVSHTIDARWANHRAGNPLARHRLAFAKMGGEIGFGKWFPGENDFRSRVRVSVRRACVFSAATLGRLRTARLKPLAENLFDLFCANFRALAPTQPRWRQQTLA